MEIHRLFLHLDLAFLSFPHASMEYAFEVGDALVVSGGNASQCVIGNLKETFPSFNYQQLTKAANKEVQVCEKCIRTASGASLDEISVQHASIFGDLIATTEPGSSVIHIFETGAEKIEDKSKIDVGSEPSCIYLLDNQILLVST